MTNRKRNTNEIRNYIYGASIARFSFSVRTFEDKRIFSFRSFLIWTLKEAQQATHQSTRRNCFLFRFYLCVCVFVETYFKDFVIVYRKEICHFSICVSFLIEINWFGIICIVKLCVFCRYNIVIEVAFLETKVSNFPFCCFLSQRKSKSIWCEIDF